MGKDTAGGNDSTEARDSHDFPGVSINLERLKSDLDAVSRFGANEIGQGVTRPSFSDADIQARAWLLDRMKALGLEARRDGAANVIGRWSCADGPAVMVGSHLDSVPMGGTLDGALGVLAGLECLRTLMESGETPESPIEVIATSEEEGRFGGMFGAQALCGLVTAEWIEQAIDDKGELLTDAMRRQGLDPYAALEARRDPSSLKAFLELHIEQGPVLEAAGIPIGVVEGISGVFNWNCCFSGVANHAGTTPMDMRQDAFQGLARFGAALDRIIAAHGTPSSRLTVGKVEVRPGFPHTVPGEAEFSLIGRDMDEAKMRSLADACLACMKAVAQECRLELACQEQSWLSPTRCHPDITNAFAQEASLLEMDYTVMPSGAGHDTQFLAQIARAGMIFIPSGGGISHSPAEWSDWADIEKGANLLLHTMWRLANE
jgi:N-carbamoyl-L-amino-acid hydrolase